VGRRTAEKARRVKGAIVEDSHGRYVPCPNCNTNWLLTDEVPKEKAVRGGKVILHAWHCTRCNTIIELE
jgi:hypothetical protein